MERACVTASRAGTWILHQRPSRVTVASKLRRVVCVCSVVVTSGSLSASMRSPAPRCPLPAIRLTPTVRTSRLSLDDLTDHARRHGAVPRYGDDLGAVGRAPHVVRTPLAKQSPPYRSEELLHLALLHFLDHERRLWGLVGQDNAGWSIGAERGAFTVADAGRFATGHPGNDVGAARTGRPRRRRCVTHASGAAPRRSRCRRRRPRRRSSSSSPARPGG